MEENNNLIQMCVRRIENLLMMEMQRDILRFTLRRARREFH